jgi:hypothetical protein
VCGVTVSERSQALQQESYSAGAAWAVLTFKEPGGAVDGVGGFTDLAGEQGLKTVEPPQARVLIVLATGEAKCLQCFPRFATTAQAERPRHGILRLGLRSKATGHEPPLSETHANRFRAQRPPSAGQLDKPKKQPRQHFDTRGTSFLTPEKPCQPCHSVTHAGATLRVLLTALL